jgi:hypothetical protein
LIRIIEFLSKNRIEHKDIYPQNIFLRYFDENLDDGLPDFVLGDLGWAQPLKDSYRGNDIDLFCHRVWEKCCAIIDDEEEINNANMANASHLSRDLVQRVNGIIDLSEKDLLTIDFLFKALLPHLGQEIRELRSKISIERHLASLPAASKAGNGKTLPTKLRCIVEYWQVVYIQEPANGSGRPLIQGLPRTTGNGKRDFFSSIRSTAGPVHLDLFNRFDADGMTTPPTGLKPYHTITGVYYTKTAKAMLEQQGIEHQQREANENESPARKKMRLSSINKDPSTVDVRHPLLGEVIARMNRYFKEDLPKVGTEFSPLDQAFSLSEAFGLHEDDALRDAIALSQAFALSEEDALDDAIALREAFALSDIEEVSEAEPKRKADGAGEAVSESKAGARTSPVKVTAVHAHLGNSATRATRMEGIMTTACMFVIGASLLSLVLSLLPELV